MVLRMALHSDRIAHLARAYLKSDLLQTAEMSDNLICTSWVETEALFKELLEAGSMHEDQLSFSYIEPCSAGSHTVKIEIVLINDDLVHEGRIYVECATGLVRTW